MLRLCCLLCLPMLAHATVGAPVEVEVLGHDPAENRVFFLSGSDGGAGEPPALWFYRLSDPWPVPVRARSWQTSDWTAHDKRLARLKQRLTPLAPAAKGAWSVRAVERGSEPCPMPDDARACAVLDVEFSVGVVRSSQRIYAWPGPRAVTRAYQVPGGGHLLIYRYRGETFESGYDRDLPVLLSAKARPTTAQPWRAACSKTDCALVVGERYVLKTPPGTLRCAEAGPWLGCLSSLDRPYHRGWFIDRRTGAAVPFGVPWGGARVGTPSWSGEHLEFGLQGPDGRWRRQRRLRPKEG